MTVTCPDAPLFLRARIGLRHDSGGTPSLADSPRLSCALWSLAMGQASSKDDALDASKPLSKEKNLELRRRHLAPALKLHYAASDKGPLRLLSGHMQYLTADDDKAYLDCVNNVAHVGHCHPRVVHAATKQLATLNTNSRYLHDNIVRLAKALTDSMPKRLSVCIFVNSGSEANDLALRLARAHTNRRDVYCVSGAYHGNSAATLAISPYNKYADVEVPAGSVVLGCPDAYRLKLSAAETADACVAEFEELLRSGERPPAAFIVESLICCGGQVVLPEGYLARMHALVRAHGGLAIADEVQVGLGRVGSHMWGFEAHGAVPDIVTVGKPFGNGFPLAAVVTTAEVAQASRNVEYFNTFGGNPVACAVGLEVLRVLADEGLQANALELGAYVRARIRDELMAVHAPIGDVRGAGLIFGVEFVADRASREPDAECAAFVMNHMRSVGGVLVSTDGPFQSVVKLKPPMCVSKGDMDQVVRAMGEALSEWAAAN